MRWHRTKEASIHRRPLLALRLVVDACMASILAVGVGLVHGTEATLTQRISTLTTFSSSQTTQGPSFGNTPSSTSQARRHHHPQTALLLAPTSCLLLEHPCQAALAAAPPVRCSVSCRWVAWWSTAGKGTSLLLLCLISCCLVSHETQPQPQPTHQQPGLFGRRRPGNGTAPGSCLLPFFSCNSPPLLQRQQPATTARLHDGSEW